MSTYIAIYMPILIMLIMGAAQRKTIMRHIIRKKAKRGISKMDNILDKCVGKKCVVSTGSMGVRVSGVVTRVSEKWIEIETRNKTEILSLDFIQNIRIVNKNKTTW